MHKVFLTFLQTASYKFQNTIRNQSGQLLVEILVAITVGGIFILGATAAILSVLRNNYETRSNQTLSSIALDLSNTITSFANADWHNIYNLGRGDSWRYFLVSKATSSIAVRGEESEIFDDIKTGLAGHWKFDEATSTTAYDFSGNSKDGEVIGSPERVASSSCMFGKCISFDDDSEYINITPMTYENDVTFSVWFKGGGQTAADWNYWMRSVISATGRVEFGTWGDAIVFKDNSVTGSPSVGGVSGFMDDQWHHAVGVINDTEMQLWVDGVSRDTEVYPGGNSHVDVVHQIGSNGSTRGWDGSIDDVRIYSRALGATEIQQLYENASYEKYFYVESVKRDDNGDVVASGGTYDPSTQKIVSVVTWEDGRSASLVSYLTRNRDKVFVQDDWSGGEGQEGPISDINNQYSSAQNITQGTSLTLATTTSDGTLYSSTFDTEVTGGAAFNSILWQGTKPSGTNVKFQIASASSSSGGGGSATGTIDSIYKYAWNDYVGWIDFGYEAGSVAVNEEQLSGYAYNDDVGEISLDCATSPLGDICATSDYKVTRTTSTGDLSGWAWNDEIGWISFCGGESSADCPGDVAYQVNVNLTTGYFSGWAWNDIIGWISFNCSDVNLCGLADYKVAVSGASGWRYIGPDGTSLTYYTPTSANTSSEITLTYHNNHRYFRYKVILSPDGGYTLTPTVESISVNWSP